MHPVDESGGGLRQGPLALGVSDRLAHQGVAVVNTHDGPRFGGAVEGRTGIVGRVAVENRPLYRTDVIHNRDDGRRWRRDGIHVDHKSAGRRADVARRVGGGHRQGVQTVAQWALRGKDPGVVGPDKRGAQQGGAVVNVHRGARLCRAA